MNKQLAVLTMATAGISSLNAASIYGYGKPQALYIQKMPHVALADTSTAREWVTDAAACASAWATGYKGRNGVVSMSPERGKRRPGRSDLQKPLWNTRWNRVWRSSNTDVFKVMMADFGWGGETAGR